VWTTVEDRGIAALGSQISAGSTEPQRFADLLDACDCEYVLFLSAGEWLAEETLASFALAISKASRPDLIYADEDQYDPDLTRHSPFLKPAWSSAYGECVAYTGRPAAWRTSKLRELKIDVSSGAAWEADIVMRLSDKGGKIENLRGVLCHRPAKHLFDDGPWLAVARRRLGKKGEVKLGKVLGCLEVRHAVEGQPLISIIVPTAGRSSIVRGRVTDVLVNCIRSIWSSSTYRNFELIVVDNANLPATSLAALAAFPIRYVHYSGPINIAEKMNLGAAHATGSYFLFLNDDVEILAPDWLEAMLAQAQRSQVGVVGAKLLFENGTIQHAGVVFYAGMPNHVCYGTDGNDPGYFASLIAPRDYLAVTGACMMTSAALFRQLKGFDACLPVNFNDVDYCFKAIANGYRTVFTPNALLVHFESVSRDRSAVATEWALFRRRWERAMRDDPYYPRALASRICSYKFFLRA
jgi:GT2 family glycosyltransferase